MFRNDVCICLTKAIQTCKKRMRLLNLLILLSSALAVSCNTFKFTGLTGSAAILISGTPTNITWTESAYLDSDSCILTLIVPGGPSVIIASGVLVSKLWYVWTPSNIATGDAYTIQASFNGNSIATSPLLIIAASNAARYTAPFSYSTKSYIQFEYTLQPG